MTEEATAKARFDCRIWLAGDPGRPGETAHQTEAKLRPSVRGVVGVFALVALLCATTSFAQDETKVKAGLELWKSSGCADCHGAFADGEKQRDEAPTGANLRTARLDAAALKQTISCGRPGTGMPAFDEGAYKVRACNGQALGPPPSDLSPPPRTLTPDEIDTVVTYLQARIIGKGRTITKQECLFYYADQPD